MGDGGEASLNLPVIKFWFNIRLVMRQNRRSTDRSTTHRSTDRTQLSRPRRDVRRRSTANKSTRVAFDRQVALLSLATYFPLPHQAHLVDNSPLPHQAHLLKQPVMWGHPSELTFSNSQSCGATPMRKTSSGRFFSSRPAPSPPQPFWMMTLSPVTFA